MAEMTIRRFSVLSLAKIQSLVAFGIGIFIGIIYGASFMIFGAFMSSLAPRDAQAMSGISSVVIGIVLMIAIPLAYAVIGFIGGAIAGLIYNLAAGIVGGIRFELESTAPAYAPPPQWGNAA
jgi:hypothetical protein